jgi:hypothetical protein
MRGGDGGSAPDPGERRIDATGLSDTVLSTESPVRKAFRGGSDPDRVRNTAWGAAT